MKNKKYLVWIILITILLTGCFGETPITPYEALQRTDLVSLIGRTRKKIYDMYLLTDDHVTILDETTIILPISYRPNDENRRWTMETWQVTLRFVPRSNGEQVLGGYQLNAYYGGPNSLQRAQTGFIASLYAYSQWEEKESDLPRYNGQVSELKNALSEKGGQKPNCRSASERLSGLSRQASRPAGRLCLFHGGSRSLQR